MLIQARHCHKADVDACSKDYYTALNPMLNYAIAKVCRECAPLDSLMPAVPMLSQFSQAHALNDIDAAQWHRTVLSVRYLEEQQFRAS